MESHDHQRLLVAAFSFILYNSAHSMESSSPADIPPNLQPVSAPVQEPVHPPTSESAPPLNSISFPPSISDPPSESISPSGSNFPSGVDHSISDPPSEAFSPFNSDPSSESISPTTNSDPAVKKICDSTDYPSLCLATVVPLLNGKTDVLSVLEVAIKATNKLAKFALAVLRKFGDGPGIPPEIVTILNDCKDSFDTVLYNFENALNAFTARDIGTMNTMLSAVITDIGDCEDEFSESGSTSPVSRYSDRLTNMTSNCLAIVSLVN